MTNIQLTAEEKALEPLVDLLIARLQAAGIEDVPQWIQDQNEALKSERRGSTGL